MLVGFVKIIKYWYGFDLKIQGFLYYLTTLTFILNL